MEYQLLILLSFLDASMMQNSDGMVKWNVVTNPIVYGKNVRLHCQYNGKAKCKKETVGRYWYMNGTLILNNGYPKSRHEEHLKYLYTLQPLKYREEVSDRCTQSTLVINKFSESDSDVQYKCTITFEDINNNVIWDSHQKNLTVSHYNYKSIPDSVPVDFAWDLKAEKAFFWAVFKNVFPIPSCELFIQGSNQTNRLQITKQDKIGNLYTIHIASYIADNEYALICLSCSIYDQTLNIMEPYNKLCHVIPPAVREVLIVNMVLFPLTLLIFMVFGLVMLMKIGQNDTPEQYCSTVKQMNFILKIILLLIGNEASIFLAYLEYYDKTATGQLFYENMPCQLMRFWYCIWNVLSLAYNSWLVIESPNKLRKRSRKEKVQVPVKTVDENVLILKKTVHLILHINGFHGFFVLTLSLVKRNQANPLLSILVVVTFGLFIISTIVHLNQFAMPTGSGNTENEGSSLQAYSVETEENSDETTYSLIGNSNEDSSEAISFLSDPEGTDDGDRNKIPENLDVINTDSDSSDSEGIDDDDRNMLAEKHHDENTDRYPSDEEGSDGDDMDMFKEKQHGTDPYPCERSLLLSEKTTKPFHRRVPSQNCITEHAIVHMTLEENVSEERLDEDRKESRL